MRWSTYQTFTALALVDPPLSGIERHTGQLLMSTLETITTTNLIVTAPTLRAASGISSIAITTVTSARTARSRARWTGTGSDAFPALAANAWILVRCPSLAVMMDPFHRDAS